MKQEDYFSTGELDQLSLIAIYGFPKDLIKEIRDKIEQLAEDYRCYQTIPECGIETTDIRQQIDDLRYTIVPLYMILTTEK